MEIKDKLKELRLKNDLTQESLADKLSVTRQTVSKWELGINEPDLDTLKKLAEIYNVSISEILCEDIVNKNESIKKKKIDIHKISTILFYVCLINTFIHMMTCIIFLKFLPDKIPAHYNAKFEVDRYGSKYETLLYVVCYPFMIIASTAGYYITKTKYENSERVYGLVANILGVIIELGFGLFTILINVKYLVSGSTLQIIYAEIGLIIMIFSFFVHPRFNKSKNMAYGVHTKFAQSSKENWNKMNKFASYVLMASSACFIALSVFLNGFNALFFSFIPFLIGLGIILGFNSLEAHKYNKNAGKNIYKD